MLQPAPITLPLYPKDQIIDRIISELKNIKHNESFPDHICAQAGRVSAAAGKLVTAADNIKYNQVDRREAYYSALSVAAQAIRFIENL